MGLETQWKTSWKHGRVWKSVNLHIDKATKTWIDSATRHNIQMYPYFLFAAIYHLNRPRLSLSDLLAQSAE